MRLVKFVKGSLAGLRHYGVGETASIPTRNADELQARGVVIPWPPPVADVPGHVTPGRQCLDFLEIEPDEPVEEPLPDDVTKPLTDEEVKPGPAGLSKRALRKMFGRKVV